MIINSLISSTHLWGDSDKSFKIICCFNGAINLKFNYGWSPTGPSFYNWSCDSLGAKDPVETIEYTKRR